MARFPRTPTAQRLFNFVAKHLLLQGVRSETHEPVLFCDDGRACAVGCLIAPLRRDGLCASWTEHAVRVQKAIAETLGLESISAFMGLLGHLREVHDLSEPDSWRDRLHDVAFIHGLNTHALDRL